jgi:transposase
MALMDVFTHFSIVRRERRGIRPEEIKLEAIKEKFPNLKKMQELKEEFRKIYETSENPTEGMLSISEWLAKSSSVFTKSCQTIRNWFGEIISYFERRTTNGMVEGINNKLKLIKRRSYGFRNFRNFWVRSMLSWHLVC